jgi:acylpyruvate hydrolase
VIFTGTPAGVGNAYKPKIFLEPGQLLTTTIAQIGSISNRVVVGR